MRKWESSGEGAAGVEARERESLMGELPSRWERLEDLVLLPSKAMSSPLWEALGTPLWSAVARALGARRLARQAPVAPTGAPHPLACSVTAQVPHSPSPLPPPQKK